jgi:ribosomal protein S18 acetylase RimI-like enzyme
MADAPLLAELSARTFLDAFGADNTPEDLALHVERNYGAAIQERELGDAALTYLVAEVDDEVAGYGLVRDGHAPPCVGDEHPIEIQRLYVERAWHGRGVAQALMAACEDEARRRGGRTLWLGVWERNPRAIRFYEKEGFHEVGSHTFLVGSDPQTDRILARPLP